MMIDFLKYYLSVIIVSLLIGKAIVLSTPPEPDIIDFIPAQQTFIK
jgi:hypothetical protein